MVLIDIFGILYAMNTYVQGIQVELFQEYTKKKDLWDDFHPKFVSRSNEKKKKNKKFIIYVPFVLRIKKKIQIILTKIHIEIIQYLIL